MMIRQFSPIFKPRSTLFPRRTQTRMATSEQDVPFKLTKKFNNALEQELLRLYRS